MGGRRLLFDVPVPAAATAGGAGSQARRKRRRAAQAEPEPTPPPPIAAPPSPHEPFEPMLAGMEEVGTGLLDRLDALQRVAASAPGGPLLIVAGPGTGKTRTLTHRIAYLCAELDVLPGGVPGDHVHPAGRRGAAGPARRPARPGRRGRDGGDVPRARAVHPARERRRVERRRDTVTASVTRPSRPSSHSRSSSAEKVIARHLLR